MPPGGKQKCLMLHFSLKTRSIAFQSICSYLFKKDWWIQTQFSLHWFYFREHGASVQRQFVKDYSARVIG